VFQADDVININVNVTTGAGVNVMLIPVEFITTAENIIDGFLTATVHTMFVETPISGLFVANIMVLHNGQPLPIIMAQNTPVAPVVKYCVQK